MVGTVAVVWLYNNFVGWLNFLNATPPPIGTIFILDYVPHRWDYRTRAARTLYLGNNHGIEPGNPASFIILDADNFYNALNQKSEVLRSYKNGCLIAAPVVREVLF